MVDKTIKEWYNTEKTKLNKQYRADCEKLDQELIHRQEDCSHEWKLVKGLFYALGETYDGEFCEKCLAQRQIL